MRTPLLCVDFDSDEDTTTQTATRTSRAMMSMLRIARIVHAEDADTDKVDDGDEED